MCPCVCVCVYHIYIMKQSQDAGEAGVGLEVEAAHGRAGKEGSAGRQQGFLGKTSLHIGFRFRPARILGLGFKSSPEPEAEPEHARYGEQVYLCAQK